MGASSKVLLAVLCVILALMMPRVSMAGDFFNTSHIPQPKIVGGTEAGAWPGYARSKPGRWLCGASLIAPNVLLTAGHCTTAFAVGNEVCIGGNFANCSDAAEIITVAEQLRHPEYSTQNLANDIMLVRLQNHSQQPPMIWNSNPTVPQGNVKAIGFGKMSEGGAISPILLEVVVPVVGIETCDDSYSHVVDDLMICAGSAGFDTCQGDSGGPLLLTDGTIAGIVSHGIGCGRERLPGIYTRVSSFDTWIRQGICTISPENCSIEPSISPMPTPLIAPTLLPNNSPVRKPVLPNPPTNLSPNGAATDDESTDEGVMAQILAFLWSLISWMF